MRVRRARTTRAPSSPYRGTAGLRVRYYLAELDELNRVVRRASPFYTREGDGVLAFVQREDRSLRLVREFIVREVVD